MVVLRRDNSLLDIGPPPGLGNPEEEEAAGRRLGARASRRISTKAGKSQPSDRSPPQSCSSRSIVDQNRSCSSLLSAQQSSTNLDFLTVAYHWEYEDRSSRTVPFGRFHGQALRRTTAYQVSLRNSLTLSRAYNLNNLYDQSEDSSAKYEVYVPDGTGEMAQQLLTLPEIRTLLARQADNEDAVQQYYEGSDRTGIVSLEGGKRLLETVPLPAVQASRVGVSDVVSSVRSIMASEMAQREQVPVVVQAAGLLKNL